MSARTGVEVGSAERDPSDHPCDGLLRDDEHAAMQVLLNAMRVSVGGSAGGPWF